MFAWLNHMACSTVFAAIMGLFISVPLEFDATYEAQHCRIHGLVFQQGQCGACLAFASVTVLGYRMCLNERIDFVPSPFRLFDCLAKSCDEGLSIDKVEGVRMRGIGDINATPPVFGWGCKFAESRTMSAWTGYFASGEMSMKTDIYMFGPSVVRIYADPLFYRYAGYPVVYPLHHEKHKPDLESTHAVAVVGWGVEPEPHWIIQNSWGAAWGVSGRAKVPIASIDSQHSWRNEGYFRSDLILLCGWVVISMTVSVVLLHLVQIFAKYFEIEWLYLNF